MTHTPRRARHTVFVLLAGVALGFGIAPATPADRVAARELVPLVRHVDDVVQTVGDVEIRASDVFRMMDLANPGLTGNALSEIVLTTLARLEASAEGVDVPRAALEDGITRAQADLEASFLQQTGGSIDLPSYLAQAHGMGVEEFGGEVRRMVLASLLLERVVRLDQMRLARDELELILVEDQGLAEEIAGKLEAGASFAALARQHSLHTSAADGGLLPPLPENVPAPLLDGRQSLQPGDWLGPAPITLEGRDFQRFVRLVERMPARAETWSELRDEIEASLAARPVISEEVAIFEARMRDRYRVQRPPRTP